MISWYSKGLFTSANSNSGILWNSIGLGAGGLDLPLRPFLRREETVEEMFEVGFLEISTLVVCGC